MAGNHPFATRPRCSNSSPIDQSDDAPQTASRVDQRICRTATDAAIAATDYGMRFSAALARDNFFGTQFHPEKSGAAGSRILRNFLTLK